MRWPVCCGPIIVAVSLSAGLSAQASAQARPLPRDWYLTSDSCEPERTLIRNMLTRRSPAVEITDQLVELTGAKGYALPMLAADELKKRTLNQRQLQRLTVIAHEIPFNSLLGCVRISGQPKYKDRTGEPAWIVLAHAKAHGKPLREQVAWLVGELRYSDQYGASPAASASLLLKKIGAPAVPALIGEMRRKDRKSQHMAALALTYIGSRAGNAALEEWCLDGLANSDDPLVWPSAATWLAELQSKRAFPVVERALFTHIEDHGTYALVAALPELDPVRGRETLAKVLADYRPDRGHEKCVQAYVHSAVALAKLHDPRGMETLRYAVASPLDELRLQTTQMLFVLGEEGRPLLQQLISDPDERVARSARFSLEDLDRRLRSTKP